MPRNNSKARRAQRQKVAVTNKQQRDVSNVTDLLASVATIIDDAAEGYRIDELELMRQRQHACGNPDNCTLNAKACAAINQNMPPHMIEGQRPI